MRLGSDNSTYLRSMALWLIFLFLFSSSLPPPLFLLLSSSSSLPPPPQELEQIAGFQSLRYLEALQITQNPRLRSIDGLSGIIRVQDLIIENNPNLCYILNEFSDRSYWVNRLPPGLVSATDFTLLSLLHARQYLLLIPMQIKNAAEKFITCTPYYTVRVHSLIIILSFCSTDTDSDWHEHCRWYSCQQLFTTHLRQCSPLSLSQQCHLYRHCTLVQLFLHRKLLWCGLPVLWWVQQLPMSKWWHVLHWSNKGKPIYVYVCGGLWRHFLWYTHLSLQFQPLLNRFNMYWHRWWY